MRRLARPDNELLDRIRSLSRDHDRDPSPARLARTLPTQFPPDDGRALAGRNPLIRYRSFRNTDPPHLAALWNRQRPGSGMVRPLSGHEFDAAAINRLDFDRAGLIVAEDLDRGELLGFAHAGFGPDQPSLSRPGQVDPLLGTLAMLVVDPDSPGAETVGQALIVQAESYLRRRGAQVLYAGGQAPLDPFYRSIYGGSEWSGILSEDEAFRQAIERAGYERVAESVQLELDLTEPETRDPKAAILRRQTRVELVGDAPPSSWWEALAFGERGINRYRLVLKAGSQEVARATTWNMTRFDGGRNEIRLGLIGVEVVATHRRQGLGRHLVHEIARHVRGEWGDIIAATTDACNVGALALYHAVGFRSVGSASLYRKPGTL